MTQPSSLPFALVDIRGLHKSFGATEVLKGIDLQVGRKEVVCIIGKSGSGKSTLLRCINGLESFERGSLSVDGQALQHGDAHAMRELRQQVGMIFQSFNLFPHLSAGRNVMLAPTLAKNIPKDEARTRAQALLERVGLGQLFDRMPDQLSGGQLQRVAIARAMIMRPEVVLADEPTGNLDSKSGLEIMALLEHLNQQGVTLVMITHDQVLGSRAPRRIRIVDGQIE